MRHGNVVAAAVGLLLMSTSANAQSRTFGIQCVTGSFRACASVDVELVHYSAGETFRGNVLGSELMELRFRIANLQGTRGFETGPHGLDMLALSELDVVGGPMQGVTAFQIGSEGTARIGGDVDFDVDVSHPHPPRIYTWWQMDDDSRIFGCAVPTNASPFSGYDETCGGSITYGVYYFGGELRMTNMTALTLGWIGTGPSGDFDDYGGHEGCTTGVDCVSVTPEPGTMILVGSALAALFPAASRRRGIVALRSQRAHEHGGTPS